MGVDSAGRCTFGAYPRRPGLIEAHRRLRFHGVKGRGRTEHGSRLPENGICVLSFLEGGLARLHCKRRRKRGGGGDPAGISSRDFERESGAKLIINSIEA